MIAYIAYGMISTVLQLEEFIKLLDIHFKTITNNDKVSIFPIIKCKVPLSAPV
jgi:hypothetical protein